MRPAFFVSIFLMTLLTSACGPVTPPPVDVPTIVDAPTLTFPPIPDTITPATPTPTAYPCPWNWAYRDTPALDAELKQAFSDAGIDGTAIGSSFGETGGDDCSYHEMDVSITITVNVTDLSDTATLADLAARIEEILGQTSMYNKPSLTKQGSSLTFKAGEQECVWDIEAKACHS